MNRKSITAFVILILLSSCASVVAYLTRPKTICSIGFDLSKIGKYSSTSDFRTMKPMGRIRGRCVSGPYDLTLIDSSIIGNGRIQGLLQERFSENGRMFRGKFRFRLYDKDSLVFAVDSARPQGNWGWYGGVPLESFFLSCSTGFGRELTAEFDLIEVDSLLAAASSEGKLLITLGGGK